MDRANVVFNDVVDGLVFLAALRLRQLALLQVPSTLDLCLGLVESVHFLNCPAWAGDYLSHLNLLHLRPHLNLRLRERKGFVQIVVLVRIRHILYRNLFGSLSQQVGAILLHLFLDDFVGVLRIALALDLVEKMSLFSEEEDVLEDQRVSIFHFGLVEVVHVQLSDEAAEVVVLEELRQHYVAKLLLVVDDKGFTIRRPRYRCIGSLTIHNLIEFHQESGNVVEVASQSEIKSLFLSFFMISLKIKFLLRDVLLFHLFFRSVPFSLIYSKIINFL